ncbi:MAG TPA: hypothetical protein PLP42_12015 [Acidobacteriota bacterium]|mgnify:CR=1 FL=1|nr:hypothetical protein [Acidobacteriota bacterium]
MSGCENRETGARRRILFALIVLGTLTVASFQAQAANREDLDDCGGFKKISSRATGFFRTEFINGRWWLITPDGHGFISAGVNHVDYKEDYTKAFVSFVVRHLKDWGFNTIGWSQESMSTKFVKGELRHSRGWGPKQYQQARMPYMHLIRFTDIEWYANEEFPDVFGKEFAEKCDRLAREVCLQLRDDPYLVGYFYSDTPNWPLWAEKVGRESIGAVARAYYRTIKDAIKRYDPNHLLFGDRFKADEAIPLGQARVRGVLEEVLREMTNTVDVLSLEYYQPDSEMEDNLKRWSRAAGGKPVLLADSAFLAPTDVLKISPSSPIYAADQATRGEKYKAFARRAYSIPLVIGWHWCAFGRSTGRRSGLLDGDDRPYEECVSKMRSFNRNDLYQTALAAGSPSGQGKQNRPR